MLTKWRGSSLLQRFYRCSVESERVPGADYAFTELPALSCLHCQETDSNHTDQFAVCQQLGTEGQPWIDPFLEHCPHFRDYMVSFVLC